MDKILWIKIMDKTLFHEHAPKRTLMLLRVRV
jgi:hypothetical protein